MSSVRLIGGDKVKEELKNLGSKLSREVRGAIENGAKVFVRNAKRDAPVDFGFLRNQITYTQVIADPIKATFEVVSGAKYSPYLEWGTVTKVDVPAELADYAIQFKGAGIIKTGGIKPQPFFFKQMPIVRKQIEADLKQILG